MHYMCGHGHFSFSVSLEHADFMVFDHIQNHDLTLAHAKISYHPSLLRSPDYPKHSCQKVLPTTQL